MADANKQLVARILLFSAVLFGILAVIAWNGVLPIHPGANRVIAAAFAICALADGLIGFFLWTRSANS